MYLQQCWLDIYPVALDAVLSVSRLILRWSSITVGHWREDISHEILRPSEFWFHTHQIWTSLLFAPGFHLESSPLSLSLSRRGNFSSSLHLLLFRPDMLRSSDCTTRVNKPTYKCIFLQFLKWVKFFLRLKADKSAHDQKQKSFISFWAGEQQTNGARAPAGSSQQAAPRKNDGCCFSDAGKCVFMRGRK